MYIDCSATSSKDGIPANDVTIATESTQNMYIVVAVCDSRAVDAAVCRLRGSFECYTACSISCIHTDVAAFIVSWRDQYHNLYYVCMPAQIVIDIDWVRLLGDRWHVSISTAQHRHRHTYVPRQVHGSLCGSLGQDELHRNFLKVLL